MGVFEATRAAVTFIHAAGFVAQDPRDQSTHGFDKNHGRHLAPIANKISDTQLDRLKYLANAIVESFVAATKQQIPRMFCKLADHRLLQTRAGGRQ
jgi:hypothetical protein